MCKCAEYESLLYKMSTWIAERTWEGHEVGCPAYAGSMGTCSCIESVRREWHKTRRLRELESDKLKRDLQDLAPRMMDLQAENVRLTNNLQWALWRLRDMLEGDDGQAWQEARKFAELIGDEHGFLRQ